MIGIREYVVAESLDQAYSILMENKRNIILGGGCFLNLQRKLVNKAIDLENLGLSYIENRQGEIHIGSETSLRDVEKSPLIKNYSCGILSKAIGSVVGTQLRNMAKIGGTVYGKFGFSDIIGPLLALDAEIDFYKLGRVSIRDYMDMERPRDIVREIILPIKDLEGYFQVRRKTSTDFPKINCSIVREGNSHRVVVGARPGKPREIETIAKFLNNYKSGSFRLSDSMKRELGLGSNIKSSAFAREALIEDIVLDYIEEKGGSHGR